MSFRPFTAQTSAAQIIEYHPDRVGIIIRNNTNQQVFISNDPTGQTTEGQFLNQFDTWQQKKLDGDDCRQPLFCATAANTADLRVYEAFVKGGNKDLDFAE